MEAEAEGEDRIGQFIWVKRKDVGKLLSNLDTIQSTFGVHLHSENVSTLDDVPSDCAWFLVSCYQKLQEQDLAELIPKLQRFITQCVEGQAGEEDSSYDSDCEGAPHEDVSRTVSDTLAAESSEWVTSPPPGYTQRVEFGLKLGYTEHQVQTALAKLGPGAAQNELLAELIKLGAAKAFATPSNDFSPSSESPGFQSKEVDELEEPEDDLAVTTGKLRHIVIDGSNVAMSHGNKETFSCLGIKLCVDWFRARGHKDITVFVPRWRKESPRPEKPITGQEILMELEKERLLVFTPSRHVGGKRVSCHDDRYILKLAAHTGGIVVSNDNYRDLVSQCPEFRRVVEERILMYSFVNDKFMPPDDPLGRSGPTLDNFLKVFPARTEPPRPCPYGKKCTYGNKCKYAHPERGPLPHKSVSERLAEHAQRQLQARAATSRDASPGEQLKGKSLSLPVEDDLRPHRKTPLSRARSSAVASAPDRQVVSKSRSVENVATPPNPSSFGYHVATQMGFPQQPTQQLWTSPMPILSSGHIAVAKKLSDPQAQESPPTQADPPTANLHRKLQRQLTLNPAYDPRIFHLQHGYHSSTYQDHSPLARHSSTSDYRLAAGPVWEPLSSDSLHHSVTRIASAPEPLPPRWPPTPTQSHPPMVAPHPRLSASSEPNLMMPPPAWTSMGREAARSRLNYHLSSIFPPEQVHAAMMLYPEETNPQKICAAILDMFSKH